MSRLGTNNVLIVELSEYLALERFAGKNDVVKLDNTTQPWSWAVSLDDRSGLCLSKGELSYPAHHLDDFDAENVGHATLRFSFEGDSLDGTSLHFRLLYDDVPRAVVRLVLPDLQPLTPFHSNLILTPTDDAPEASIATDVTVTWLQTPLSNSAPCCRLSLPSLLLPSYPDASPYRHVSATVILKFQSLTDAITVSNDRYLHTLGDNLRNLTVLCAISRGNGELLSPPTVVGAMACSNEHAHAVLSGTGEKSSRWVGDWDFPVVFTLPSELFSSRQDDVLGPVIPPYLSAGEGHVDSHALFYFVAPTGDLPTVVAFAYLRLFDSVGTFRIHTCASFPLRIYPGSPPFLPCDDESGEAIFSPSPATQVIGSDGYPGPSGDRSAIPPPHLRLLQPVALPPLVPFDSGTGSPLPRVSHEEISTAQAVGLFPVAATVAIQTHSNHPGALSDAVRPLVHVFQTVLEKNLRGITDSHAELTELLISTGGFTTPDLESVHYDGLKAHRGALAALASYWTSLLTRMHAPSDITSYIPPSHWLSKGNDLEGVLLAAAKWCSILLPGLIDHMSKIASGIWGIIDSGDGEYIPGMLSPSLLGTLLEANPSSSLVLWLSSGVLIITGLYTAITSGSLPALTKTSLATSPLPYLLAKVKTWCENGRVLAHQTDISDLRRMTLGIRLLITLKGISTPLPLFEILTLLSTFLPGQIPLPTPSQGLSRALSAPSPVSSQTIFDKYRRVSEAVGSGPLHALRSPSTPNSSLIAPSVPSSSLVPPSLPNSAPTSPKRSIQRASAPSNASGMHALLVKDVLDALNDLITARNALWDAHACQSLYQLVTDLLRTVQSFPVGLWGGITPSLLHFLDGLQGSSVLCNHPGLSSFLTAFWTFLTTCLAAPNTPSELVLATGHACAFLGRLLAFLEQPSAAPHVFSPLLTIISDVSSGTGAGRLEAILKAYATVAGNRSDGRPAWKIAAHALAREVFHSSTPVAEDGYLTLNHLCDSLDLPSSSQALLNRLLERFNAVGKSTGLTLSSESWNLVTRSQFPHAYKIYATVLPLKVASTAQTVGKGAFAELLPLFKDWLKRMHTAERKEELHALGGAGGAFFAAEISLRKSLSQKDYSDLVMNALPRLEMPWESWPQACAVIFPFLILRYFINGFLTAICPVESLLHAFLGEQHKAQPNDRQDDRYSQLLTALPVIFDGPGVAAVLKDGITRFHFLASNILNPQSYFSLNDLVRTMHALLRPVDRYACAALGFLGVCFHDPEPHACLKRLNTSKLGYSDGHVGAHACGVFLATIRDIWFEDKFGEFLEFLRSLRSSCDSVFNRLSNSALLDSLLTGCRFLEGIYGRLLTHACEVLDFTVARLVPHELEAMYGRVEAKLSQFRSSNNLKLNRTIKSPGKDLSRNEVPRLTNKSGPGMNIEDFSKYTRGLYDGFSSLIDIKRQDLAVLTYLLDALEQSSSIPGDCSFSEHSPAFQQLYYSLSSSYPSGLLPPALTPNYFLVGFIFPGKGDVSQDMQWRIYRMPPEVSPDRLIDSFSVTYGPDPVIYLPNTPVCTLKALETNPVTGNTSSTPLGTTVIDGSGDGRLHFSTSTRNDRSRIFIVPATLEGSGRGEWGMFTRFSATVAVNSAHACLSGAGPTLIYDKYDWKMESPAELLEKKESLALVQLDITNDTVPVWGFQLPVNTFTPLSVSSDDRSGLPAEMHFIWSTSAVTPSHMMVSRSDLPSACMRWVTDIKALVTNRLEWLYSVSLLPEEHAEEVVEIQNADELDVKVSAPLLTLLASPEFAPEPVGASSGSSSTPVLSSSSRTRVKRLTQTNYGVFGAGHQVVEVDETVEEEGESSDEESTSQFRLPEPSPTFLEKPQLSTLRSPEGSPLSSPTNLRRIASGISSPVATVTGGGANRGAMGSPVRVISRWNSSRLLLNEAEDLLSPGGQNLATPTGLHYNDGDYKPKVDPVTLAQTPIPWIPNAPPSHIHPSQSPIVSPSYAIDVLYAAAQLLLAPNWTYPAGLAVIKTLLIDFSEAVLVYKSKKRTELRRAHIRHENALAAAGMDVSNIPMPDFDAAVAIPVPDVIVDLEEAYGGVVMAGVALGDDYKLVGRQLGASEGDVFLARQAVIEDAINAVFTGVHLV